MNENDDQEQIRKLILIDDIQKLVDRGVNPKLAATLAAQVDHATLNRTIDWYDRQNGRVGAGVLVAELKNGGKQAAPKTPQERDREYGEQIVEWLRKHFPEWNRDHGNRTHSAAIAAVIRLHHQHGTKHLSAREHGPAIRAAVQSFEERFMQ